jgi:hypothetical protein
MLVPDLPALVTAIQEELDLLVEATWRGTPFQRVFQAWAQGQYAGRWSVLRLRCGAAIRAGTVTIWRRRVAPRATASRVLARVPAARSRLRVIPAQMAHGAVRGELPGGHLESHGVRMACA